MVWYGMVCGGWNSAILAISVIIYSKVPIPYLSLTHSQAGEAPSDSDVGVMFTEMFIKKRVRA